MCLTIRLVLSLLFFLTAYCVSLAAGTTHAQGEFQTDYQVQYSVDVNGKTSVNQNITLKNKTDNYYADKFELKIGSIKVENVSAQDDTGQLETNVKFEQNYTTIAVKFKQKVIGHDKTLPWKLTYSSAELTTKSGQIWEVSIPKLASGTEIGTYNASVNVPASFGPIAFMVPDAKSTTKGAGTQELTFDKEQLLSSGIAISFGQKQVFSFELSYFIENNNITSKLESITLPPDNNYQRLVLESINPKPMDVDVDEEGNFVAKYRLSPKQKLSINVKGEVEVFSKPFRRLFGLSHDQRKRYLEPQPYWETDNAFIKNKANELKTPKKIYDFVQGYLSYDKTRLSDADITRKGAAAAVNSPSNSVCMEFTDLFIAIARSAGIPAREVEGYAYTQNERLRPLSLALTEGDVLHAWPEYWDDKLGWIQVDPTWGSTSGGLDYFDKLDFNHISFVHRGLSSTYPYPAGTFKKPTDTNKKTVSVSFAQELPSGSKVPEILIKSPDTIIAGIPAKINVELKNSGNTSIIGSQLTLDAQKLKITPTDAQAVDILPPYAKKNFTFNVQGQGFFVKDSDNLISSFFDVQTSKPVSIVPLYRLAVSPTFLASVAITLSIVSIGLVLYNRHKKA